MKVGEICRKPVVSLSAEDSLFEAARQMREHHVGDVVVTRPRDGVDLPVGILTDRDIVVSLNKPRVDLEEVTVGEVMTRELIVAREDDDVDGILRNMKDNGIRRVPVIDRRDQLIGILSVDDLMHHFAAEFGRLSRVVDAEIAKERRSRS